MKWFIADSHTDFMTAIKQKQEREDYVKRCIVSGVKLISCAIFTTESYFCIEDIKRFKTELDYLSKKYNIKMLLSIEDLGFVKTCNDLYKLIELNPFSVSLTWNYLNQYGGGADTSQGLTALGKKVVKLLEENNVLIDTAHLSKTAFNDFVNITTLPIFNSHSNIFSLHQHQRNLTDWQIQQIVHSNGYLGITIYDKFISNQQITSKHIAEQFRYLVDTFGANNFGLGSDLYGFDLKYSPSDVKEYSDFANVVNGLEGEGLDFSIINKLMYRNFDDFVKK